MRFLLDEDVFPEVAAAARALGLDVVSVHELGRLRADFPDPSQLRFAAGERRLLVTRNGDDYIRLTREFFQTGEPHYGVLIIPHSLSNEHAGRIARALRQWSDARQGAPDPEPYTIDFVGEK
jgi:predicted nuclease of predicted toxin-antitoxin system